MPVYGIVLVIAAVITVAMLSSRRSRRSLPLEASVPAATGESSLAQLMQTRLALLTKYDLARMNLICMEGLPGSELADLEAQLKQLNEWSAHISAETRRHWYRFERSAAEFNRSEGYFRMLMMSVVLAEDFHVQYDPTLQASQPGGTAVDGFFKRASPVFVSGVLGAERKGTCSSLPVLYVALGRRLGYPLYLVTTKGHLFVRWEGRGERFNIEATSHGLNTFDDDYYRKWPFPITSDEESAEGYLKSLDSAGELAVFLSIRGMCLRENGRLAEAAEAFANAARRAPGCRTYAIMHAELERQAQMQVGLGLISKKGTLP